MAPQQSARTLGGDKTVKAYGPIGQCIYCGGREHLSREHIIPYGLHGNLVIQEACCAHCRDVTSALEGRILRGALLPMRTKRKFPTRHKDRRPEKFTISIQRGEETELIEVSPDDHPAIFGIPIFRPPAFRNDPNYQEGTIIIGEETLRFGDKPHEIMRRFDAEGFEVRTSYKPSEFARLIGKIGYSFVVACMGIDAIKESLVLSAVLGTTPDIGRWVGS